MTETMIEITNLHKSFGSFQVLRGVNLTVNKGESMTVIGGSGSGKSVLMKHIIGLLFPDKGEVKVAGQTLNNLDEHQLNELRKKFGMLFQMAALFDSLTVWENVGFGLKQHTKLSDKEIRAIATEKLALVGLKNVEDKMPVDLSGGMRKRVGLARAIAMDAEIILYDEPTTGLDPITADAINDLIVDLRKKLGVTSVAIPTTCTAPTRYRTGSPCCTRARSRRSERPTRSGTPRIPLSNSSSPGAR